MALQQEIWKPTIEEFLFAKNSFVRYSSDVSDQVLNGKVVHIPNSGGPSTTLRNPATFPLTVVQRTDSDVTYTLDNYAKQPTHIQNIEQYELSYNKRVSWLRENLGSLIQDIGHDLLYKWASTVSAGMKLATTGAAAAATAPGATGNRKIFTEADIIAAETKLNDANVAEEDRVMIIPSAFLEHLKKDTNLKYAFQGVVNLREGTVARLHGFDIVVRSRSVVTAFTGDVPKLFDAATATDDNASAIFFQKEMVEHALGEIKMFENLNDPTMLGDVYNISIRMGGRMRRASQVGCGLIIAKV